MADINDNDLLARNKELAEMLSLIAGYYVMARDTYRAKSFTSASEKISEFPYPILSGDQAKQNIKGIGDSIKTAIDEFLNTGSIQRLVDLQNSFQEQRKLIDWFLSFYGIGPKKAIDLYNNGIRTLEDLWVKGNLNDAQKLGIMWREHIGLPIPRNEMDIINTTIHTYLDPYSIKWTIAGSYRRGAPTSGDIDILIESRPDITMDSIVTILQPILPATLAHGPKKFMGMIRISDKYNAHRIDIRLISPSSYAYGLLYFTGSQQFNILMRRRAIEMGLILNEYGLYPANNYFTFISTKQNHLLDTINYPAESEEDIFKHLRVQYLSPEQRTKTLSQLTFY